MQASSPIIDCPHKIFQIGLTVSAGVYREQTANEQSMPASLRLAAD